MSKYPDVMKPGGSRCAWEKIRKIKLVRDARIGLAPGEDWHGVTQPERASRDHRPPPSSRVTPASIAKTGA